MTQNEMDGRIYREGSRRARAAIKTVRCGVSARGFYDSREYAKAVYRAGGPSLTGIPDIGALSGPDAEVLSGVYVSYDRYQGRTRSFSETCALEVRELASRRPAVFVIKLPLNGRTKAPAKTPQSRLEQIAAISVSSPLRPQPMPRRQEANAHSTSDLTIAQVTSMISAAEFGQVMRMPMDTLVTLDFERLGAIGGPAIEKALERFLRGFYAWCRERGLLAAYLAVVEMSHDGRPHAHCAVFVPGVTSGSNGQNFRPEFRIWVREYTDRNYGRHIPRAVDLRMENKESWVRHWMRVHYLMKSYDRSAILIPAYHADDGNPVYLGDVIAYDYSYAGDVPLKNRVRVAQLLGPAQRSKGAPADCREARPFRLRAFHEALEIASTFSRGSVLPGRSAPYRSAADVGRWDVRKLFSPAFIAFVNRRCP